MNSASPLDEAGDGPRAVEVTAEEQAAIRQFLKEPGAPGAKAGPNWAMARAALKFAGALLLAAGVVAGYGDGNEFDEVGCSVAQRPGGASHGARSRQAQGDDGGTVPGASGSAGSAGGSGSTGRPECQVRAQKCAKALSASVEGDPASGRFSIRFAPANEAGQDASPPVPDADPGTPSLAARVFELLSALDPGRRIRKAPPITVFLLRYRRNLSRSEIAQVCDCDKSLIAVRLRTIQEKLPWQPRQLRELSAQVEAMQEALTDPRARRIYRRGAVYGSQEENEGLD